MLTEDDLDHYMIWSGYAPQSREAMRPFLARGVRWLTSMGVTRSPLRPERLPSYSYEAARSHDLINLWLKEHNRDRDSESEHELRDLLAQIGAPVRPYRARRRRLAPDSGWGLHSADDESATPNADNLFGGGPGALTTLR